MKILNGNEAFTAMCAGQKIESRFIESQLDFDDIRNFPATVFIDAAYEFRIAVTYITIGEMQVPEPIRISPEKGATCSYPSLNATTGVQQFKWNGSSGQLRLLKHGQVHLSMGHAITHCVAIILVSGGEIAEDITQLMKKEDVDCAKTTTETAPPLVKKKITDPTTEIQSISVESELQLYLDGIKACNNESEIESTLLNAEKVGFSSEQMIEITMAKESKLAEFSQTITQILQDSAIKFEDSLVADPEYQKHLEELLDSAAKAQTPVEANALIRYTKSWTEVQCQPLIIAISKRLGELEQPVYAEVPSLMTRILNAPNLNEVEQLLAEVRGRHPDIQPKLMGYINQRRFELNNPVDQAELNA